MALLGRLRQTILIKEKRKHLSKMSDRVSKMVWSASAKSLRSIKVFVEVHINNQSVFVIIYIVLNESPESQQFD
jgi:hypothetical protein